MYNTKQYWEERYKRCGKIAVGLFKWKEKDLMDYTDKVFNVLIPHLPRKIDIVLDFGCGYGRFAPLLLKYSNEYVGVDDCDEALEIARTDFPGFLFLNNIEEMPTNKKIDLIFTHQVLQFIDEKVLLQLNRKFNEIITDKGQILFYENTEFLNRNLDFYKKVFSNFDFEVREGFGNETILIGRKVLNNVLLLVGEGLGNLCQTLFLIPNLKKRFKKVDILIVQENFPTADLYKKEADFVWNSENWGAFDPNKYDGKIQTLWASPPKVRNRIIENKINSITTINDVSKQRVGSNFLNYKNGKSEFKILSEILLDLGFEEDEIIYDVDIPYEPQDESYDIILANTSKNFTDWNYKRYLHWEELAKLLSKKYTICSIGSREEYIKGAVNKTGLSLPETSGLIKSSRLVITNDSGIYHLANVLRKENIVIFTGTSVDKNYDKTFNKYSRLIYKPCKYRKKCQFDKVWGKCSQHCRHIEPQIIANKVKEILKEPRILIAMGSYDGEERLEKSLESLFSAKNKSKFDVYILDDYSSKKLKVNYPVTVKRTARRSEGIGEVKTALLERILRLDYDYYYLTDDDYEYTDGWLDKCLELISIPGVGISTVFCHPGDYDQHKHTQVGDVYYPRSTMGGSIFISKEDLQKIYDEKSTHLSQLKGYWDRDLTNAIFGFGKKIVSTVNSYVQHNPWDMIGFYKRVQTKGLGYVKQCLISVIIPCWNQLEYTKKCIESIKKNTTIPYELIVVDNGSVDGTLEYLKNNLGKTDIIIRNNENKGFSRANNQASKLASGEYLLFLNNDTVVEKGWLKTLYDNRHVADVIGASICFNKPDFDKQEFAYVGTSMEDKEWSYVEGWCLFVARELFEGVGRFDERFSPAYCEDADLCYQVRRKGGRIKKVAIGVHHFKNKSSYQLEKAPVLTINKRKLWDKYFKKGEN